MITRTPLTALNPNETRVTLSMLTVVANTSAQVLPSADVSTEKDIGGKAHEIFRELALRLSPKSSVNVVGLSSSNLLAQYVAASESTAALGPWEIKFADEVADAAAICAVFSPPAASPDWLRHNPPT